MNMLHMFAICFGTVNGYPKAFEFSRALAALLLSYQGPCVYLINLVTFN